MGVLYFIPDSQETALMADAARLEKVPYRMDRSKNYLPAENTPAPTPAPTPAINSGTKLDSNKFGPTFLTSEDTDLDGLMGYKD